MCVLTPYYYLNFKRKALGLHMHCLGLLLVHSDMASYHHREKNLLAALPTSYF